MRPELLIICGPTASGKTNFAHQLALKKEAELVNADAMQLYKGLELITASPPENLKQQLPYHLYNFQEIHTELSAASYAEAAANTILNITSRGKLPILVGGSGMYIKMLINGYSAIPAIDSEIRTSTRELQRKVGNIKFYQELAQLDQEIVKILNPNDTQRLIRAYEVVKQTGQSILYFQQHQHRHLLPTYQFRQILLMPTRQLLYDLCAKRLDHLFRSGAVEEVESLWKKWGNLNNTAMKALGVREIIQYLQNKISKDTALQQTNIKTRQYAKRQTTWFKNQCQAEQVIDFSSMTEYQNKIEEIINKNSF